MPQRGAYRVAFKQTPAACSFFEQPLSTLTGLLERSLQSSIVDQTGLKGNYDFRIQWNAPPTKDNLPSVQAALGEQLGLELVPGREPIAILVVEKAN